MHLRATITGRMDGQTDKRTDRWTDKNRQTIAVTLCLRFAARVNQGCRWEGGGLQTPTLEQ